jgi:hypothetical protein
MAAAVVIVRKIGSKRCPKGFFVDCDDVIEALSANGSNQALDIGCLQLKTAELGWSARMSERSLDELPVQFQSPQTFLSDIVKAL